MSLGDGGLDAQVEQRMDAYRGNPQQLQKRYGQNKELMDLLALQKLKTEKEQTARAMQLEQEQQPGTIAEQREAEALELVKQEQAGTLGQLQAKTKDTLDQKQKMQGKGMNKIAQSAGKPPQQAGGIAGLMGGGAKPPMPPQGGPQAAGLPNARMMQAAQGGPVRRMAGGGIVGFAGDDGNNQVGGLDDQTGLSGKRQLTDAQKFKLRQKFGGSADRLINQIEAGTLGPLSAGADTRQEISTLLGDPVVASKPVFDPLRLANPEIPEPTDMVRPEVIPSNTPPAINPVVDPPAIPPAVDPAVDPVVDPIVDPTATDPRTLVGEPLVSTMPESEQTLGKVDAATMGTVNDISGDVALRKGTAFADDYLKRDEKNQSFEDMQARMAAFDKENYSPNEDLNNFLIGMGGTGSMGAAMKGGKAAMDKSRTNRRNRMVDEFLMETDRMDMDAGLGKAGLVLGTQMSADANANERNIRTITSQMTMKQMDIARADADRIAKRDEALLISSDRKLQRDISLLQVRNQTTEIKQVAATKILTEVANTRDALRLQEEATGPYSEALLNAGDELAAAIEDGNPNRITGAEAEVAAIRAKIVFAVENVLNTPNADGQNRLELESLANDVFADTLTMTGSINSFTE